MSETMAQVPSDSPLMIAWEAYKLTPDYATNRKWALYEAHVDGALWAAFCAGFANQPATPPTPPRDAVREALVRVLGAGTSELDAYEALGAGLGLDDPSPHRIADALLAAVSRPAEARGEPTDAEVDAALKSLEVTHHWNTPTRDRVRLALKCANQAAAPRPETGEVSEAMVEAFSVMWDGQKTLEKHNHERIRASLRAALAAREGA